MRRYADSVGCVGVVQFLWHTCVISERAQPPLVRTSLSISATYVTSFVCWHNIVIRGA